MATKKEAEEALKSLGEGFAEEFVRQIAAAFPAELIGKARPIGAEEKPDGTSRLTLDDGRILYRSVKGAVTREGGIPNELEIDAGPGKAPTVVVLASEASGRRFVTWDPEKKAEFYRAPTLGIDIYLPKE